jgi:hypothetical protein
MIGRGDVLFCGRLEFLSNKWRLTTCLSVCDTGRRRKADKDGENEAYLLWHGDGSLFQHSPRIFEKMVFNSNTCRYLQYMY